jgi:hypothetical protein
LTNYSKSRFRICLNNQSDNSPSADASISDSKLSVDKDGVVTIPGSLVLNGMDVATALSAGVPILNATGQIPSASTQESVEAGRYGVAGMVRIASTYATLRLEGVGQSQNFTGFSIVRNSITQGTVAQLGTVQYQSWVQGTGNTFHQPVTLGNYNALLFDSGPKLQRMSDNSLSIYSGYNQAYKAMTLQGSDGHVITHVALHNYSDASLKSDVVPASSAKALEVLKAVEPKVYKRTDLQDDSPRLGFIAQDFAASIPTEWSNIVGATEAIAAHTDDDGNEVLAKPSTLTMDYARLNAVLWQCCRNMLARIEALESA